MCRPDAWNLVCEFVQSDSLRKHMLAVEAAMRRYARRLGEDEELWGVVGLVHDFDYELWPEPPDHTRQGAAILRQRGVDEEIIGAMLSHAPWNRDEYPLDRPLRRTLSACDELCGFLTACALIRPTRLVGLTASSVRKKLKTPSFAANVSRQDVYDAAEWVGRPLEEHIEECIAALADVATDLGLA
ncbi:MAG: HDIG domain-containing protein [Phycisphaerae bacterium]|nr:HDIG domain-containing protein [Phycisphaerae bacterium]NUQ47131.1 HDIG domain-containing protein [Phycisphaerae bacterium]